MKPRFSTDVEPLTEKEIRQQARANIIEQIKSEKDFLITENENDIEADYGHLIDEETERLSSLQTDGVPFKISQKIWAEKERKAQARKKEAARQEQARRNAKRQENRKRQRANAIEEAKEEHRKERERIQQIVKERGITRVCHFTRYSHLKSIQTHGIRSTHYLKLKKDIEFQQKDTGRFDNVEGISCTVQFPNAKLLTKWMNYTYSNEEWVILYIKPDVLWQNGQVNKFFQTNAATLRGSLMMQGSKGFESMFYNEYQTVNGTEKRDQSLAPHSTSDPQSEVIFETPILWDQIRSIVTPTEEIKQKTSQNFPGTKVILDPYAFDLGTTETRRRRR